VGKTRDDAAGEAFDKVAKLLGLPYPGGPVIDRLARMGRPQEVVFPVAKITDQSLDFSFSGIKTAVLRIFKTENLQPKNEAETKMDSSRLDLLAGFQESIVNALWSTTAKAAAALKPKSIMLSGGVAANSRLREIIAERSAESGLKCYVPSRILTTDNAAMIAAAGTAKLERGEYADVTVNADPNLRLAVADRKDVRSKRWKT
jgi:N6-L-threonylcarbamoyladenine synthase